MLFTDIAIPLYNFPHFLLTNSLHLQLHHLSFLIPRYLSFLLFNSSLNNIFKI